MRVASFLAAAAGLAVAAGAQAQVWAEIPDAPALPPGQMTVGAGPLIDITGTLTSHGDVDMFCIEIFAPTAFGAWTESVYPPGTLGPAGASFDTQLWLFHPSGAPIMHGDDSGVPGSLLSAIGFGSPSPLIGPPPPPFAPGIYMLAISEWDIDALDPAGGEIWADLPFEGWSGPDGTGGPLAGWTPSTLPGGGTYHIVLTGAAFCAIPAPGTVALLGFAGLLVGRRRR